MAPTKHQPDISKAPPPPQLSCRWWCNMVPTGPTREAGRGTAEKLETMCFFAVQTGNGYTNSPLFFVVAWGVAIHHFCGGTSFNNGFLYSAVDTRSSLQ